ncbi:MAG TPA: helix-turn-helix domain-containing protein [Streptosporangiaceae bacterium]|jgi:DNA-binding IclR family transcriptional regulator
MPPRAPLDQDRSIAQTLSRGLRIVELLAGTDAPMTAQALADELGTSRSIVYRLLTTLGHHGLLDPGVPDGRFALGLGMLTLSRRVVRDLREAAVPELHALTRAYSATSFAGVREGGDLVCVVSAEPDPHVLAIRHREGLRLPLDGASGLAIRAADAPAPDDPRELRRIRERGYAVSRARLVPGALGVSAPVRAGEGPARASITLIFTNPDGVDVERTGADVRAAAERVARTVTM